MGEGGFCRVTGPIWSGAMGQIPLLCRGRVVATAVVDGEDEEKLLAHRWSMNNNGYALRVPWVGDCPRAILMHRQILGLSHGDGQQVDHINRDKLDNRRANLRIVNYSEQAQNRSSYRGSTSRFRGVYWAKDKQRWRVRPGLNGIYVHVGYFKSELEAAEAAEAWRREHMPFAEPDPLLVAPS